MVPIQFNKATCYNAILLGFLMALFGCSGKQPPPAYKIVVDDSRYMISVLDTARRPYKTINEFTSEYRISGYELKDVCPLPGEEIILTSYEGGAGGESRFITVLANAFNPQSITEVFSHLEAYEGDEEPVLYNIQFVQEAGEYIIYVDETPFIWDGTKFARRPPASTVTILDSLPERDIAIATDQSQSQMLAIRSFSSKAPQRVELPIKFDANAQVKVINWKPQPLLLTKSYETYWAFRKTYLTIYTNVFTPDTPRVVARLPIAADGGEDATFFYRFSVAIDPRPNELRLWVYPGSSSESGWTVSPDPSQNDEQEAPLQYVWDTVKLVKTGQVTRLADYPGVGIELSMPDEPIRIHRFLNDSSVVVNEIPGGAKFFTGDYSPVKGPELVVLEVEGGYKWCFDYRVRIYANFWNPDSTRLVFDERLDRVSRKYVYVPTAEQPVIWTFDQEECSRFPEFSVGGQESIPDTTKPTYVWLDSIFVAKK